MADRVNSRDLTTFACGLIQSAGILLKLPQVALATAQLLLHRVYKRTKDYPIDMIAMASVFLAAKVEEYPRRAREVIDVFTKVIAQELNRDIVLHQRHHDRVKQSLFDCEKLILKFSGFDLLSKYPHKMLINYYLAVVRFLDREFNFWTEDVNKKIIQKAWNYCNDSMRIDVFSKYETEVVVCSCLEMSLRDHKLVFPRSSQGEEWYKLFVRHENEVRDCIRCIEELYEVTRVDIRDFVGHLELTK